MDKETRRILAVLCELVADYVELKILDHQQLRTHLNEMGDFPVDHFQQQLGQLCDKLRTAKDHLERGEIRAELDNAIVGDFEGLREELKERGQNLRAERAEYARKTEALLGRMRDSIRQLAAHLQE